MVSSFRSKKKVFHHESTFGRDQLQKGMLNNMLGEVGIDDVGSFVNQFRQTANGEASSQHQRGEDYDEDGEGGNNSGDMIQGAMKAYKMFSGGQGHGGGGGGLLDNISTRTK
jgi:hypothetical protein